MTDVDVPPSLSCFAHNLSLSLSELSCLPPRHLHLHLHLLLYTHAPSHPRINQCFRYQALQALSVAYSTISCSSSLHILPLRYFTHPCAVRRPSYYFYVPSVRPSLPPHRVSRAWYSTYIRLTISHRDFALVCSVLLRPVVVMYSVHAPLGIHISILFRARACPARSARARK